jgi:hypothetical protein
VNQILKINHFCKKWKLGAYEIIVDECVATKNSSHYSIKVAIYTRGDIVIVVHVIQSNLRVRGRLNNGTWIDLQFITTETNWVKYVPNFMVKLYYIFSTILFFVI